MALLMITANIIGPIMFYFSARDKKYYKKIMDTSRNIIIVRDKNGIKEVNDTFFKYFNMYNSLNEFKSKNGSISEFFVQENGYLKEEYKGIGWIDFILQNKDQDHKIKLKIAQKEYYLSASASVVSEDKEYTAIILSDISEEEKYKNELEFLSCTDFLTGIRNRRHFQQSIEEESKRAKRYASPLSMVIFDIDYFKQVNDEYGHNVGDEVLIEYTKLVDSVLRANDIFCRIGGEEFIILLPNTKRDDAALIAEKLRQMIESSKKIIPITMSFGVVEYIKGEETEAIFKRADKALYKAKDSGRNIVVVG
jgi:diguanylate cyclase (GGDEF)-like protein